MEPVIKRNIAEKIFIGLLCAVVLVLPFHKVLPSPLLTLAALIGIFTGSISLKWKRLKQNKPVLIFASLYLVFVFGYLLSENKQEALKDLQLKLSIVLIPVIFGSFIELRKKEIILIFMCFVISCISFAAFALAKAAYDYYLTGNSHFYYKELVAFTFIHPSYIAMFEVFAVVLLLFKLFNAWKNFSASNKVIYIGLILFLLLFIFLLSSKMAIFSLFILINFLFYIHVATLAGKLKTILLLAVINLLGLTLLLSLPTTRERFMMLFTYSDVGYANSTDSREEIWKSATEIAKDHLLVGIGSGDAEQILVGQYQKNNFQKGVDEKYNAHNQYLQFLIETGIFGLLVFLFILFYSLRLAIRSKNYIYLSFLLLFMINIFTESMLKTQSGVVFYAFFNTLLGLHFGRFEQPLTKT